MRESYGKGPIRRDYRATLSTVDTPVWDLQLVLIDKHCAERAEDVDPIDFDGIENHPTVAGIAADCVEETTRIVESTPEARVARRSC